MEAAAGGGAGGGGGGGGGHLLSGDPASLGQCLLVVDVDRIDANEPETQTYRFTNLNNGTPGYD